MKFLLGLIAVVALGYGVLSIPELLLVTTDSKATVWQEISARLAIGLSLLIFAVSAGLAAILAALEQRAAQAGKELAAIIAAIEGVSASRDAQIPTKVVPSERPADPRPITEPPAAETAMAARPRSKDALDQAAESLYSKPAALR
jgi:hypothetical protein